MYTLYIYTYIIYIVRYIRIVDPFRVPSWVPPPGTRTVQSWPLESSTRVAYPAPGSRKFSPVSTQSRKGALAGCSIWIYLIYTWYILILKIEMWHEAIRLWPWMQFERCLSASKTYKLDNRPQPCLRIAKGLHRTGGIFCWANTAVEVFHRCHRSTDCMTWPIPRSAPSAWRRSWCLRQRPRQWDLSARWERD